MQDIGTGAQVPPVVYNLLHKGMEKTQRKYRHVISLGHNCEIAFNFWRLRHCLESSLFTWTYACIDQLIAAITNLDKAATQGFTIANPEAGTYFDNATFIGFHSRMNNLQNATPEQLKACEAELCSRVSHLKEKFRRIAETEQDVLYVYKYKCRGETPEQMASNIASLSNALTKLHAYPYTLLIVCEEAFLPAREGLPKGDIHIRTVKHFSDDACVTSSEWDKKGWKRIFTEFPHQNKPLPGWFKTKLVVKPGKRRSVRDRIATFFSSLPGINRQKEG